MTCRFILRVVAIAEGVTEMKKPWEWQEADVLDLIRNKVPEGLDLDYKESRALSREKRGEICKDVSAFANSAGGTLVYGVAEDPKTHEPCAIDGCDPAVISKEWIEQVINSGIQRRIDGIRINPISLSSTPTRCIYVVWVPESSRAPHMAVEKHRYYKRFNFQSIPMEDYEVRDVSRRGETPDLELRLRFYTGDIPHARDETTLALVWEPQQGRFTPVNLSASLVNNAVTPAEYVAVILSVDARLTVPKGPEFTMVGRASVQDRGFPQDDYQVVMLELDWGIPERMPIWSGMRAFELTRYPFQLILPAATGSPVYFLQAEVHSPRMVPRSYQYQLRRVEQSLYIIRP